MHQSYRWITTAAALAVVAGAAPPATADPLVTAKYKLKAKDGSTIQQADCLADRQAAQATFCQFLIARSDGPMPSRSGSETLQWLRDARAAGAAKVTFTEAGDGFTGRTTNTVPANDTSRYRMTAVGSYPPNKARRTSSYEITSIAAMAADIDCLSGRGTGAAFESPYGWACGMTAMRPASVGKHKGSSAKRRHAKARRRGEANQSR